MEHSPSKGSRVVLIVSYGGTIQPRLNDHSYSYIGGDTRLLIVDRNIKLSNLIEKFSSIIFSDVCFKYQCSGEDLNTLIPVYNEEDLDDMMFDYDDLCRISPNSARLRVFLFPVPDNNNTSSGSSHPMVDLSLPPLGEFYPLPPRPPKKDSSPPIPALKDLSPPPPSKNAVKRTMSKEFQELNIMNDGFDMILNCVMESFQSVVN